jgi:hypothetical protein
MYTLNEHHNKRGLPRLKVKRNEKRNSLRNNFLFRERFGRESSRKWGDAGKLIVLLSTIYNHNTLFSPHHISSDVSR